MEYDREREAKILLFVKEHTKVNDIGFKYMTQEDKDALEKLQFDLSDVWVYTDEEHFHVCDLQDRKEIKNDVNAGYKEGSNPSLSVSCDVAKTGGALSSPVNNPKIRECVMCNTVILHCMVYCPNCGSKDFKYRLDVKENKDEQQQS